MLEITIVKQKKYVLGFIHAPDTTEERIHKLRIDQQNDRIGESVLNSFQPV